MGPRPHVFCAESRLWYRGEGGSSRILVGENVVKETAPEGKRRARRDGSRERTSKGGQYKKGLTRKELLVEEGGDTARKAAKRSHAKPTSCPRNPRGWKRRRITADPLSQGKESARTLLQGLT